MSFDWDLTTRLRTFLTGAFESAGGTDAYAAGIFVHFIEYDARRPVAVACVATEAGVEEALARRPGLLGKQIVPADAAEARWAIAFWAHPDVARFADPDEDPEGAEAIERWIRLEGLWYTDEDEERDIERTADLSDEIEDKLLGMLVEVVGELHRELVPRAFGRAIPIVIQDPDFMDSTAEATERANPAGLAREYLGWLERRLPDPA